MGTKSFDITSATDVAHVEKALDMLALQVKNNVIETNRDQLRSLVDTLTYQQDRENLVSALEETEIHGVYGTSDISSFIPTFESILERSIFSLFRIYAEEQRMYKNTPGYEAHWQNTKNVYWGSLSRLYALFFYCELCGDSSKLQSMLLSRHGELHREDGKIYKEYIDKTRKNLKGLYLQAKHCMSDKVLTGTYLSAGLGSILRRITSHPTYPIAIENPCIYYNSSKQKSSTHYNRLSIPHKLTLSHMSEIITMSQSDILTKLTFLLTHDSPFVHHSLVLDNVIGDKNGECFTYNPSVSRIYSALLPLDKIVSQKKAKKDLPYSHVLVEYLLSATHHPEFLSLQLYNTDQYNKYRRISYLNTEHIIYSNETETL